MFNVCDKMSYRIPLGIPSKRCATRGRDEGRLCDGFTLVELLAVIAIIAILAALLFPAIGTSMRKAKEGTCGSNLRQLGAGLLLFAADNDCALPAGQGNGGAWPAKIGPYIGGVPSTNNILKVLRCPSHSAPAVVRLSNRDIVVGSYAALVKNTATTLNDPYELIPNQRQGVFLGWFGLGTGPVDLRPLSMIPDLRNTAMLTELAHNRNDQAGSGNVIMNINLQIDATSTGTQTGWSDANNVTLLLHNGRINYLFADGSVGTFDYNSTNVVGTGTPGAPRGVWTVYPGD